MGWWVRYWLGIGWEGASLLLQELLHGVTLGIQWCPEVCCLGVQLCHEDGWGWCGAHREAEQAKGSSKLPLPCGVGCTTGPQRDQRWGNLWVVVGLGLTGPQAMVLSMESNV